MAKRTWAVVGAGSVLALLIAAGALRQWERRDTTLPEVGRLAEEMHWQPGQVVAEIGAGSGAMALFAARTVGPTGRVWANEIDPALVTTLKQRSTQAGLANVTVVQGSVSDANLPEDCCDAIYMRWVYHHFDRPAEMDKSLFRATRPHGLLAVVDFTPRLRHEWKARVQRLFGAGEKRPDGVSPDVVIEQVTAAGFILDRRLNAWPGRGYCLIFRKAL